MRHPHRPGDLAAAVLASALPGAALLAAGVLSACSGAGGGADLRGVPDLVKPGEALQMARALPASQGAGDALALVVRAADKHDELRIAERSGAGWKVAHVSRPGDEFRNLLVEDVNSDGRPDLVSRWAGGQIEIVEILGRGADNAWSALLQNGAEVIEERRRPDRTVAFWLTSRTYEEEPGHPPVYETTVYGWNGRAFVEEPK
jgi:hypothetical protein